MAGLTNGTGNRGMVAPQPLNMADWNYEALGCLELTLYTGCCAAPLRADALAHMWTQHENVLVELLKQVGLDMALLLCWVGITKPI